MKTSAATLSAIPAESRGAAGSRSRSSSDAGAAPGGAATVAQSWLYTSLQCGCGMPLRVHVEGYLWCPACAREKSRQGNVGQGNERSAENSSDNFQEAA